MNVFSHDYESWLTRTHSRPFVCIISLLIVFLGFGQCCAQSNALRVGTPDIPPSLGNPYTAMGVPASHFWGSLYDGLTAVASDGSIQPALAAGWVQTSANVWEFTLRTDATFHNGRLFEAASVITTLNYLRSPEAGQFLVANEARNIAGVRALDEFTIEITTTSPDAALPRRMSLIMMIEPASLTAFGMDAYALDPVGTGPFKFENWGRGNRTALMSVHRDSFRRSQSVEILEFIEIPNGVAREQALISGEVALVVSINPDSVAVLRSNGIAIQIHQRSQILSIALPNTFSQASPLNSPLVRQALNYAVDRPSIAEFIYSGMSRVASQGAIAGTVGFNAKLAPYPYDPEQARQLLSQAGYPNGFSLSLAVLRAEGSVQELAYQQVAQDLNAVGIETTLTALDGARFLRHFVGNQWDDYDGFSLLWNNEPMRDVARSLEYFSCLRPRAFFCDEATTEAIAATGRMSDPAEREQALQDIMASMQNVAPAIWLVDLPVITAANSSVDNIAFGPSGLAFEAITINR